jgi:hypothetical protein
MGTAWGVRHGIGQPPDASDLDGDMVADAVVEPVAVG